MPEQVLKKIEQVEAGSKHHQAILAAVSVKKSMFSFSTVTSMTNTCDRCCWQRWLKHNVINFVSFLFSTFLQYQSAEAILEK